MSDNKRDASAASNKPAPTSSNGEKQVRAIAALARIKINDEEISRLAESFTEIQGYFSTLTALELDPQSRRDESQLTAMQADKPRQSGIKIDFSPYAENQLLKVPKVVE